MFIDKPMQTLKQAVLASMSHAVVSAFFWMWIFGVVLGLGFKDKATWSTFDHASASAIPVIAMTLAAPGKLFLFDGWAGLLLPWLGNSMRWATVIVATYQVARRWCVKHNQPFSKDA